MTSFCSIADQAWETTSITFEPLCGAALLLPVKIAGRILTIPFIPLFTVADFFRRQSYYASVKGEIQQFTQLNCEQTPKCVSLHRELTASLSQQRSIMKKIESLQGLERDMRLFCEQYGKNEPMGLITYDTNACSLLISKVVEEVVAPRSAPSAPIRFSITNDQMSWADRVWEKSRLSSRFHCCSIVQYLFNIAVFTMLPVLTVIDFVSNRSSGVANILIAQRDEEEGKSMQIAERLKKFQAIRDSIIAEKKSPKEEEGKSTFLKNVERRFDEII